MHAHTHTTTHKHARARAGHPAAAGAAVRLSRPRAPPASPAGGGPPRPLRRVWRRHLL